MQTFKDAEIYALIVALERAVQFYEKNWREWDTQTIRDLSELKNLLSLLEKPKVRL